MQTLDCWIPDGINVVEWASPLEIAEVDDSSLFIPAIVLENGDVVPCGDGVPVFSDKEQCMECAKEIYLEQVNNRICKEDWGWSIDEQRGSLLPTRGQLVVGYLVIPVVIKG